MDIQEFNASSIKNLLGEEISSLMNKLTDSKQVSGLKYTYSGKVEDNNDPEKLGRCKIRVYGVHSKSIPSEDLPWATPDFGFIGSSLGSFIVPPIDAVVNIYFDKGDIYNPKYTTKVLDGNLPNNILDDYPDTMVLFETDNGEYFKINRKTGVSIYRHSSGAVFTINAEGSFSIDTVPTDTGNLDIVINGDAVISANNLTIGEVGMQSIVTPALPSEGGPFCAIPMCHWSGAPHQGKVVKSCRTIGGLEVN